MILVADDRTVLRVDPESGATLGVRGLGGRPTAVAWDPWVEGRAWCGTREAGVFRSEDVGATWWAVGLEGERVMTVEPSPAHEGLVWVGTEPSRVWRSGDGGESWERVRGLEGLPSSTEWAFPPRPETHHVRWIGCHPRDAGVLWVAIEAGALIRTRSGGAEWLDRVPGGPRDTHELAIHPDRPETLRVAAGDGYFESHDGGESWSRPREGLEVGYLRSVAVDPGDPDAVVVSAATHAHVAYAAGRSDGRLYRRAGGGPWRRVTDGWPEPPDTIAPLLRPGSRGGEVWAADERGLHRSANAGVSWRRVAGYDRPPSHLRGLAVAPRRAAGARR